MPWKWALGCQRLLSCLRVFPKDISTTGTKRRAWSWQVCQLTVTSDFRSWGSVSCDFPWLCGICIHPTWWNHTSAFIVVIVFSGIRRLTGTIAKRKTFNRGEGSLSFLWQRRGCGSCVNIWLSVEQFLSSPVHPIHADSPGLWAPYALSVCCSVHTSRILFTCFIFHFMNKSITRLTLYHTGLVLFIPFEFD